MRTCFKCGRTEEEVDIIAHHTSYTPEVIVDCCKPCHGLIHHRIRKENRCSLSPEEAHRLSKLSSRRRWGETEHGREYKREYHKTHREEENKYGKENMKRVIHSTQSIVPNVYLYEDIGINLKTGNIYVNSYFDAKNGKQIIIQEI